MSALGSIPFASCSLAVCALLLVLAFGAMHSAVRLAFALGDVVRERARCRRRGAAAAGVAIVMFAVVPADCLGSAPTIVLTVAAVDCWLAMLSRSAGAPALPRATVLPRKAFHAPAR